VKLTEHKEKSDKSYMYSIQIN